MKAAPKLLSIGILVLSPLVFAACSSNSAQPATYAIGGTVVNLSGAAGGLVLENNLTDSLSVKANGTFAFATSLPNGATYNVKILSQPSNPIQICSVTNGSGTATANVTNVEVNCGHNEWAWEKGAATVNPDPVYGTLSVPAATNTPGGRQLPLTWTDSSGNLWLFGGYAFQNIGKTYALMNDLWKYGSGQWTWMGGSNIGNQSGTYGTLGAPGMDNIPGGRYEAVSWTDSSGNFWLFGGIGYDSSGTIGRLSDLWKYSNSEWTWISGSNHSEQRGVYGTLGAPSPNNIPGARIEAVSWTDPSGNLWLFGGFGLDSTGTNGPLNDLWEYRAGQWIWESSSKFAKTKTASTARRACLLPIQFLVRGTRRAAGRICWGISGCSADSQQTGFSMIFGSTAMASGHGYRGRFRLINPEYMGRWVSPPQVMFPDPARPL